jgi:hypothetical protein
MYAYMCAAYVLVRRVPHLSDLNDGLGRPPFTEQCCRVSLPDSLNILAQARTYGRN